MRVNDKTVKKLVEKYKEISTLGKIEAVLGWDLNVNLPPKGSEERAQQVAYMAKLISEKWLEAEFKAQLAKANVPAAAYALTGEEGAIVRNLNWGAKYYHRVPKEIIIEFAETSSRAFSAWQEAKKANKFSLFAPHLKKIVRLNQLIAEHMGYKDNPYDALLDLFEPGLTAKKVGKIFKTIQPALTKILAKIKKSPKYKEDSNVVDANVAYSADDQRQLCLFVLKKMGYDLGAGRMDISTHPFTTTLGNFDVRITNRYKPNDFRDSLMIGMHETGHALYEQGVKEEYASTPLAGGVSLGIHESQSRFWENQVGRSWEFIKFLTPILHAFYPDQLSGIPVEEIFRLFNNVRPSLIRTEADEITYNLHIALRFELENKLMNNKIKVDDLPKVWKKKMKEYLGITPKEDADGVLQDVHWSHGPMGYFPTYTLGNLYAAQFTNKMKKELQLNELVEKGEWGTILSWLRTNIHQYGSLYWPEELVKKVTGEALNPKYFLNYIKDKYSKIYGVKP
ncbi:hypothetical protein A2361_02240 [Candidatus Woesebacteria bacterium RIFOXYB1_FULL_40_26]|uniref:Metal-dependent carboxypeptidase n=2 Tax=Candidatus Woeseibacteriota TaxID=1752722 RepID=A0A0G0SD47_9BACT|nr:MAG: Thermostable carboxypeptidase [Candidatus Woesebacteria bacterium GW2011_GWA1_40_45]OGM79887.1 MAG: hypothetical protein A2361_02240 [Candidatus Woesebacteria bacterium RIFOXYB1_FULL_40_26]